MSDLAAWATGSRTPWPRTAARFAGPRPTYRLQFHRDQHDLPRRGRAGRPISMSWASATSTPRPAEGRGRQPARLRRRRLRPAQSGVGQRRRLSGHGRRPAAPRHGADPGHRAQSHGRSSPAKTPGGTTCWRTAPARPMPATSTSTGGPSRRNSEQDPAADLGRSVWPGAGIRATAAGISRGRRSSCGTSSAACRLDPRTLPHDPDARGWTS